MRVALHTRLKPGAEARMAELLAVTHEYGSAGAAAGLPVVWEL